MWGIGRTRDRRRSQRKTTRWEGHCCVCAPGARPDSPCSIEDVSRHGATVVVEDGLHVVVGDDLVVEVERMGSTPVGFRVMGKVRDVRERDDRGGVRIGLHISFDEP